MATERPSAVLLIYHRFGEADLPSTNTPLDMLDEHIAALREGNYTVLPLPEIVAALQSGEPLPPRTVGITVDDAYRSFLTEGWPRFRDAGLPVTLFVSTKPVSEGQATVMNWDELRSVVDEPLLTIGHHSHSHKSYAGKTVPEIKADLSAADALLEEELGTEAELFAFPYGETHAAALEAVRAHGFTAAFGQHSGAAGPGLDPHYLPRFPVTGRFAAAERLQQALNTTAMPVSRLSGDVLARPDGDRGGLTLTLHDPRGLDDGRLGCFAGDGTRLSVETLADGSFRAHYPPPLPTGRVRINCTHPAPNGGFYWAGWQAVIGTTGDGSRVLAPGR